jgi:hypothetical protein
MLLIQCTFYTNVSCSCNYKKEIEKENYTPTRREGAILQSSCPSVHIFVTDISASTGRNDFIFDIWLWHGDLYRFSPFQVYRTSTSCLPRDLEFFMFAVMKTFVTDISASIGRNYFIFDIWLWHGDLYRVSPFQVYCTSTSCLPCDLEFFMFGIMKIFVLLLEEMILYLIYGFGMVTCTMSPSFQAYRTSTSCLPHDLEFFMFAVMKTFVTDISASTGRNNFIFDMWLWHGDLYHVSPFQVYCTSTSCLPCDLRIFHVFTAFSGNEC